ncbi:hypothetical protein [Tateyamaria sp.]|uniref:hypothetical protein n=1 Tax=Tateyamaria sp. TaxID=1929288 RepID=UPI00329AECEF
MLIIAFLYFILGLGAVAALSLMIMRIGALAGNCPHTRERAYVNTLSIATGFAAIGAGGVLMIGAILPLIAGGLFSALMLPLGFAALCLGLGFTHAMGMLRAALVDPTAPQQGQRAPQPV